MRLVIAEKPELGRNIAHAVCGAPKGVRLPYEGEPYTVVACAGHLLELEEPSSIDPEAWGRPWREEALPILPRPWPKVVAEGKDRLVETIAGYVARADEVIHAGDPDDEGQLIVDELLEHLGYAGPVKRVLVNDSIDKNIRRAFERMDDNEAHAGAGRAANARAIADMCFGVNESRLATLRAGHGRLLSVGRVQTPTLGLVVRRDLEIASHKASEYLSLTATCELDGKGPVAFRVVPAKDALDEAGRLSDEAAARGIEAASRGFRGAATSEVTRQRTPCPLPFSLTTLTEHMGRVAKMGAKRVMAATQGLRERHRAITYNRSDCPYLPTEAFAEAPSTLATAMANVGQSWELDLSHMPRCFDDSKINAHTGIIPQDERVDASALGADERAVYEEIVKRYAMQFAGDELFDQSLTRARGDGFSLEHKARRQVAPGWRAVADDGRADKGFDDGWVDAGTHRLGVTSVKSERKRTKPKRPYTEGTLVKDMASCSRYLEDPALREALRRKDEGKPGEHGSIGTTATRAAVIETLKARGYVQASRGYLVSTELGRRFYEACPPEIRGVDTTARWWLTQERVAAGEADEYAVAEEVVDVFRGHLSSAWEGVSLGGDAERLGKCPVCGKPVVDRGPKSRRFTCSSNRWEKDGDDGIRRVSGCGWAMWKTVAGHTLTHAQATQLLERGRTGVISGFRAQSGKSFSARLVWRDREAGTVAFEFDDRKPVRPRGGAGGTRGRGR